MLILLQNLIDVEGPGGGTVSGPSNLGTGIIPANLAVGSIIAGIYEIILIIAGILTFIWLIIGGFRLLFSGGDPKNIAGARDNITFALIGFAIVFGAWWLTLIVQRALGLCIVGLFAPEWFFLQCP